MPTPMQRLAKLALEHPELRPDLMPLLRRFARDKAALDVPDLREWERSGPAWVWMFEGPGRSSVGVQYSIVPDGDGYRAWFQDTRGRSWNLTGNNPSASPEDAFKIVQRHAVRRKEGAATGPSTTEVFEKKIDHGYEQPIAGGTDIMKRLQDKFLIEQGRQPREPNPRLAFCQAVQRALVNRLQEGTSARTAAEQAITRYMQETGETVVVKVAAEDIINYAVAVALDPKRIAHIIHKHTVWED